MRCEARRAKRKQTTPTDIDDNSDHSNAHTHHEPNRKRRFRRALPGGNAIRHRPSVFHALPVRAGACWGLGD